MKKQPKVMESSQNQQTISLAEFQEAQKQAQQLQAVAQESVNRLVYIETRLTSHLSRKPNLLNILFHWRELIATVDEIVRLIKEFKDLIQKPQEQPNDTNK